MQQLTRNGLAKHYDVSPRTIQRWEKEGLPVTKIGRIRRYDLEKVDNWFEEAWNK